MLAGIKKLVKRLPPFRKLVAQRDELLQAVEGLRKDLSAASGGYGSLHRALRLYERNYDPATGDWRINDLLSHGPVEMEVGRLWHSLVMLLQPRLVLETGTYTGYSTACIASGLLSLGGQRRVITIDPSPWPMEYQVWAGTELQGLVDLRRAKSSDAFAAIAREDLVFDMLVLDSDHHYDTIMTELVLYEPLLREGGHILLHDSLYFDGVGAAVRQMSANPRFQGVTLDSPRRCSPGCRCPGVTIVRKERDGNPALEIEEQYLGWEIGDVTRSPLLRGWEPDAAAA
jgi:predicted O-methyltransferase YrrM